MQHKTLKPFPKDFLWGASTSAYQVEGANLEGAVFEDAITTHMTLPDGKEITSDEDLKQFVEITKHV